MTLIEFHYDMLDLEPPCGNYKKYILFIHNFYSNLIKKGPSQNFFMTIATIYEFVLDAILHVTNGSKISFTPKGDRFLK